jgi:hypothetical protein
MQIGQTHHCRTQRIAATRATCIVESSGDLVAWRWPSGVQLEWVGRQDMEMTM